LGEVRAYLLSRALWFRRKRESQVRNRVAFKLLH
jgi:hypothetical protein